MAFDENNGAETGAAPMGSAADLLGGGEGGATAGGGDGGAVDGGNGDTGSGTTLDGVDPDWYAQLSADAGEEDASLRDWVKAVGVKDLNGLAKIARDNQRAVRDSGRIKVPGEGASPEDIASFHKAIGVPEDPKGYEIKAPVGDDGEPIALNTGLLDRLSESAHKAGMPKQAFEAVVSDFIQLQLDEAAAINTQGQKDAEAVVKGWGADATEKLAAVDRAAAALNLTRDDLVGLRNAWGAEKTLTVMARLGGGLTEDTMLTDTGRQRFGVTGAQAQAEMDRLKTDRAFMDRVMVPGSAEYVRWNRLQDAAAEWKLRQAQGG